MSRAPVARLGGNLTASKAISIGRASQTVGRGGRCFNEVKPRETLHTLPISSELFSWEAVAERNAGIEKVLS